MFTSIVAGVTLYVLLSMIPTKIIFLYLFVYFFVTSFMANEPDGYHMKGKNGTRHITKSYECMPK